MTIALNLERAYGAGMASGRLCAEELNQMHYDSRTVALVEVGYREDAQAGLKRMRDGSRWYTRGYVAYLLGYARGFREVVR